MSAIAETEIGRAVVAWLAGDGWDVYQEVACRGSVADIVAVRGPVLWAIECKTAMSFDVIGQALAWRTQAHLVSIAVPAARDPRWIARRICADYGVGVIELHRERVGYQRVQLDVREKEQGEFRRRIGDSLHKALRPEQKQQHAGSAGGGHWTPFRETCRNLADVVAQKPGIAMKEAISQIKHHYRTPASARSSLLQWIAAGRVKGVRLQRDGRVLTLFPNP